MYSSAPHSSSRSNAPPSIKARFGQDVRRIPLLNEDLAYDDLVRRLVRVFSVSSDVVIKYLDDDGELVTIAEDADLTLAKQALRGSTLRLTLTDPGKSAVCAADVKAELLHVSTVVSDLVRKLDAVCAALQHNPGPTASSAPSPTAPASGASTATPPISLTAALVSKGSTPEPAAPKTAGSAFDPLTQSAKFQPPSILAAASLPTYPPPAPTAPFQHPQHTQPASQQQPQQQYYQPPHQQLQQQQQHQHQPTQALYAAPSAADLAQTYAAVYGLPGLQQLPPHAAQQQPGSQSQQAVSGYGYSPGAGYYRSDQ